jgi:hydrogenase maturation protease
VNDGEHSAKQAMPMKTVVLGIGNLLMGDEGFGVHAIRALAQHAGLPADVELVDGGTGGMELLPQLEGLGRLIVMDAVRTGASPGSLLRLDGNRVPALFQTRLSPHQVALADVLAALAFAGRAPLHLVLIGIEPCSIAPGIELSAEIASRLPEAVCLVLAELNCR